MTGRGVNFCDRQRGELSLAGREVKTIPLEVNAKEDVMPTYGVLLSFSRSLSLAFSFLSLSLFLPLSRSLSQCLVPLFLSKLNGYLFPLFFKALIRVSHLFSFLSSLSLNPRDNRFFEAASTSLKPQVNWCISVCGRAVAGKLGRFQRDFFPESVPGLFRWTEYRSRPGTNFPLLKSFSAKSASFPATAVEETVPSYGGTSFCPLCGCRKARIK